MAFNGSTGHGQFQRAMQGGHFQPYATQPAGPSTGHAAGPAANVPNPFAVPGVPPLTPPPVSGPTPMEDLYFRH